MPIVESRLVKSAASNLSPACCCIVGRTAGRESEREVSREGSFEIPIIRKRVMNPIWRNDVAAGQDGRHREVRDEEAGVNDVGTGARNARGAQ